MKIWHALAVAIISLSLANDSFAATPQKKKPVPVKSAGKASQHGDMVLYRYKNERGVTVTSNYLEQGASRRGYQIMSPDGIKVLEVVPPEPNAEERAAIKQEEARKIAEEKQRIADQELLKRYSTIEELEQVRNKSLQELRDKLNILNSNLVSINKQIEVEQHNAAKHERDGRKVPEQTLEKIKALFGEQENTKLMIGGRQEELQKQTRQFDEEISHYRKIKPSVGATTTTPKQ